MAIYAGHSHRRRVQSCDRGQDVVKRSRHFLGVGQMVKQCAGALSSLGYQGLVPQTISTGLLAIKRRGRSFCACAINRWSRAKIRRGQAVKAVFQRSKILTPVAALDTAPMGSDPPPPPPDLQHVPTPITDILTHALVAIAWNMT